VSTGRILLAIFAIALVLRVWGIGFGLPHDFTPDEIHEIVRALKLGAGEYSWVFGKGGLYLILFVEYGFLFAFWWLAGRVDGANEFALQFIQDPTAFYLLGRVTVALMGALTCIVVYHIGNRVYDRRTGIVAALLGATAYFHGVWSHYINVDIGMTLAVWACVLSHLTYEETGRRLWLVVAGALAAVAIAFKLPGGIAVLLLVLALLTANPGRAAAGRKLRDIAIGLATAAICLVIIAPESVPGIAGILGHFSAISGVPRNAGVHPDEIFQLTQMNEGSYLRILLRGPNLALTLIAVAGAVMGIVRRDRWSLIFVGIVAGFLLVMVAADRPGQERYLLPVIPAIWLLGARGIEELGRLRRGLTWILVALVAAHPLFALMKQNYMWTRPDTRVIAKSWIEAHVPAHSKILMDGMQFRFIQSPPLMPDDAALDRRIARATSVEGRVSRGLSQRSLSLYYEAMQDSTGPRYDLYSTEYGLAVGDLSQYPRECFDYIITSSDVSRRFDLDGEGLRHPDSARFYRELPTDDRFTAVYTAQPVPWKVQGPAITVYDVEHSCR
jgi:hypothetical protein